MAPAASTRWCPTPEQVMILEEMYRSGVRTPNAAHIQQITAHLSLYGKIEGKNVFYWFQNHKARDRQKLRKKLLGKQLHQHQHQHHHQQQQHLLFSHHLLFPPFDHHNYFHHHFTTNNNNSNNNNYHHFDQPPLPPPPPPPAPPVAPPCCGSTASSLGLFHHLPPANSLPCLATHQARAVDVVPRMTNTYTWNMETNSEAKYGTKENAMEPMMTMLTNNDHHHHHDDWMMMRKSSGDYHYHHHHHDSHNYNDDDDSRRSIKTLELFPIKDKTSLKEDNNNNSNNNNYNLSFV